MEHTILCTRCNEWFKKPERSRIRIAKIGSQSTNDRCVNIYRTYYLCPKCSENLTKWLSYPMKKKRKTGD